MTRAALILTAGFGLATAPLAAQLPQRISAFSSYESYNFDPGVAYSKMAQFAVPIGVYVPIGRMADLTISTGFTNVQLTSRDTSQLADQTLSGALDTELRLAVNVLPGRVVAFATGVLPTGIKTVEVEELSILGAVASDVIGFRAPTLGTGGSAGGGFGAAMPLGRSWSLGFGASGRIPFSYNPVTADPRQIKPGTDVRVRAGIEGAIARRTYVRVAGVFAHQNNDVVGDSTKNGVGNRFIGHVSLNQGLGSGSIVLYAFDVLRGDPQIEPTAIGAALLPAGNLFGTGVRYEQRLGANLVAVPRVEFRISQAAADTSTTKQTRAGDSWRFGADLQYAVSRSFKLVLQGSGLTGAFYQSGDKIKFSGWRGGLFLEWRR